MLAFYENAIISVTRYQIEFKLPFRNDNVFVLKVLSINFNFKELEYAISLRMQCCVPYATS